MVEYAKEIFSLKDIQKFQEEDLSFSDDEEDWEDLLENYSRNF